jgi:hypothetical protein
MNPKRGRSLRDPLPTPRVLHTGRRSGSKPPFKLRQQMRLDLDGWDARKRRQGAWLHTAIHIAIEPAPSASQPKRSACTRAGVRSTPRLQTPTVDRPPGVTPGRCVPTAAGAHCEPPTLAKLPHSPLPEPSSDPLITPLPFGPDKSRGATPLPMTRQGRWICHPFCVRCTVGEPTGGSYVGWRHLRRAIATYRNP